MKKILIVFGNLLEEKSGASKIKIGNNLVIVSKKSLNLPWKIPKNSTKFCT
jgi:hypothetical protein